MLNPWKDGPQHVRILELCAIMYRPQKMDRKKNRAHLLEDSMHPMDMEEDTYARAVVKRRSEKSIHALTFEETGHPHDGLRPSKQRGVSTWGVLLIHLIPCKGACRLGGCS